MRRAPHLAHLPFAPRRLPFFYGWVVVVVATVGTLMSIPGQTMGVSVFTDALLDATGLSRLEVSNAYLGGTLLSGLTLPYAGTLLDRFGARATAFGASVVLAATLVVASQIDRAAAALGGSVGVSLVLLTAAFYALRLSGQGTLTMVSRTMLGRWFDRRRGLASGLSGVAVGFGFGAAPRLLDAWIEAASWRGAWLQMAAVVGLGMGLVALIFFRDDPESCGLRMDGRAAPAANEPPPPAEVAYTRGEALRTLAFWAVSFALSTQSLVLTGITFHIVDLGSSVGLDRAASVAVFLPLAVVSTSAGLVGGVVGDRVPVRALVLVMMAGQAVGLWGAVDLSSRAWLFVLGFGLSGGLFGPLSTIAFPRFFGRRHLGAIVGAEMMCLVIASAMGPSLLAASKAFLGSYAPALYGSLALPGLACALALAFEHPAPTAPKPASG